MDQDIPKVSSTERDALLNNVKNDYEYYQASIIKHDEQGNGQKFKLFVMANITTFHLIHNSSTKEEIDAFCDKYQWFYPLFITIKELLEQDV
ncbi:hypothetical protein [Pseudoalteromonas denitrificans]|uniref:Uncharacterized protein n=1 Tax=Pseudoalteromonas denitrificans DSM 6059 TaxID=1123010 RepID=A0A1I1I4M7_9GAMM|nr:hypothetical protein [Pseudoalteromonas denitrificans]SFC31389.1 hypothetical protein SAMN02745724_01384 [Pseudoalteromonas denitrificans DSM 6059]